MHIEKSVTSHGNTFSLKIHDRCDDINIHKEKALFANMLLMEQTTSERD